MKLTKRGELVFSALLGAFLFSLLSMAFAAIVAGAVWLATHEQVTDQSSCKQTIEGVMCDFTWEEK